MKSARLLLGGIGLVLLVIGALIPLAAALRYLFVAATYKGHLVTIARFIVLRNAAGAVPDALLVGLGCIIVGLVGLWWATRTDEGRARSRKMASGVLLTAGLVLPIVVGISHALIVAVTAVDLQCQGRACSVEAAYQSTLTLATAQDALRSALIFGGTSLLLALVARMFRRKATTR